jgi:hypothetical protein
LSSKEETIVVRKSYLEEILREIQELRRLIQQS